MKKKASPFLFPFAVAFLTAAALLLFFALARACAEITARQAVIRYLGDSYQQGQELKLKRVFKERYRRNPEPTLMAISPEPGLSLWPGRWLYRFTWQWRDDRHGRKWLAEYTVSGDGKQIYTIGPTDGIMLIYDADDAGVDGVSAVLMAGGGVLILSLLGLSILALHRRISEPKEAAAEVLDIKLCDYSQLTAGRYGLLNRRDPVVLFCVEGRTVGLICEEALAASLQKGNRGVLAYRGNHAVSFGLEPAAPEEQGEQPP